MNCYIYKGNRKENTYLYIAREGDFSDVPEALTKLLGDLEFVVNVDLEQRESLAQADIDSVRQQLAELGYFLQLPPDPKLNALFSTQHD